jgi:F-box protein 21
MSSSFERTPIANHTKMSACLDAIAQRVCMENPSFHEKSTREKVLVLLQYLSSQQLIGVRQKESYHDLQNNFIGIALLGPDHASLPLISAAIFSSVAKRLGLNAHPCAFPFHVLSIIHAPTGQDLHGNVVPANAPHETMYVDPFQSTEEVSVEDLLKELKQMGTATTTHATYLGATAPPEMVLRTGRNILNSVQHLNTQAGGFGTRSRLAVPDVDNAFYAALWGSIMIGDNNEVAYRRRRNYLQHIIQHFESHNPNDVSLVEKYIMPLFEGHEEHEQLRDIVRATKGTDMMPKTSKRRTPEIAHDVKYKIGQVFRHKRYQYEGVITGWDVKCSASEDWIVQMRVNDLDRGANQSFYHVLCVSPYMDISAEAADVFSWVSSGGESSAPYRYVAEDNILIITPDYPEPLMWVAGRHFKRWDKVMHCFISNVRDEYPDD